MTFDSISATVEELDAKQVEVDAGEGRRVLDNIYEFIGRFVSYPSEEARVAHALWCVHAHLMDLWDNTPRLAFLSPEPGSGKSRALEITELLVPNPISTFNATPAYLSRRIGQEGGCTVLFDEIDALFGPRAKENEETRAILNAGYRRGATAGRCVVKGKTIETEDFPAYAPVALAGLHWLPDTITSRCIIVRMRKRRDGEHIEPFRRRIHGPEGETVRSQIELWCRAIAGPIEMPQLPATVTDRDADIWESLIAVADLAGGEWPARARRAAVVLLASSKEREPSLGVRLLADLKAVFGSSDRIPTKQILEALHAIAESPWRDLKGKPLDDRGLARRLRDYEVKSKDINTGTAVVKGYYRADLHDVWLRYVQTLSNDAKCVHCGKNDETMRVSVDGADHWLHRQCIEAWSEKSATP